MGVITIMHNGEVLLRLSDQGAQTVKRIRQRLIAQGGTDNIRAGFPVYNFLREDDDGDDQLLSDSDLVHPGDTLTVVPGWDDESEVDMFAGSDDEQRSGSPPGSPRSPPGSPRGGSDYERERSGGGGHQSSYGGYYSAPTGGNGRRCRSSDLDIGDYGSDDESGMAKGAVVGATVGVSAGLAAFAAAEVWAAPTKALYVTPAAPIALLADIGCVTAGVVAGIGGGVFGSWASS